MEFISVFNDVFGPVMRGPSSSHTAGSYFIGRLARSLLGERPNAVTLVFDPSGSYAQTFREQGADLGFAAGFLDWPMTDERFPRALESAAGAGLSLEFKVLPLPRANHPNFVEIRTKGVSGHELTFEAKSIGGGMVLITRVEDWEVELNGKFFDLLIESSSGNEARIEAILADEGKEIKALFHQRRGNLCLIQARSCAPFKEATLAALRHEPGIRKIWFVPPLFYIGRGEPLFARESEMISLAESLGNSLGRAALRYESKLLGLSEEETKAEMLRRWEIMLSAVKKGLRSEGLRLKLLEPSAAQIFQAISQRKVAVGGVHARAAARAMAALHVASSGGVICAAPTGASSGVIPGVLMTLAKKRRLSLDEIVKALFAAAAVGLLIARRATFAAETAGCQVEIGAAAAMAAASVVEAAGGTPHQACDAAAISLQNSMGLACDLVQGICEIPCHTRNAVAAANAFVCADLILGGYKNPIPLEETMEAVFSAGQMLPRELRCTSLGGIALAPSAQRLRPKR